MRRLLPALALLASGVFAQDRAAGLQKDWTNQAEFDLASAAAKESDPAARLADLDKWAAEFPVTQFFDGRLDMYLLTYQQLNEARQAFDLAQKILETRPTNFNALIQTLAEVRAIKPAPTPADLDAAERVANLLLSDPDAVSSTAANKTAGKLSAESFLAAIHKPAQGAPLQKVEPQYSEEASLAGLEGSVLVRGTIGGDGLMHDLSVSRPLGLGLDEQAIAAVTQMRFNPSPTAPLPETLAIDFVLPSKQSRWHLVGAEFKAPAGVSRPTFAAADYPLGPGVGLAAYDEAEILSVIGRAANATVAFDIDERGNPAHFQVMDVSDAVWAPEAVRVVQSWRFHPGMEAGLPISVPCTLKLVWGPVDFTASAITTQVTHLYPPPPEPQPRAASIPDSAILSRTEPAYTEEARQAGLEGTAWLALEVDRQGTPVSVKAVGPFLGLGLEGSAMESLKQWRFEPKLLSGQPATQWLTVQVRFSLSGVETSVSVTPPVAVKAVAKPKK